MTPARRTDGTINPALYVNAVGHWLSSENERRKQARDFALERERAEALHSVFGGEAMQIFSRAPWILKALAMPLAATLIYAHQLYAHANHGLSLWKGGGMGMFAGLDTPGMRFVSVYVVDTTGERRPVQAFSQNERRIIQRLQTQPDDALLNTLGDSVLGTPWYLSRWAVQHQTISRDRRINAGPWARTLRRADILDEGGAPQSVVITSAEVEYWRLHYDGARHELYAQMERSVVVSR